MSLATEDTVRLRSQDCDRAGSERKEKAEFHTDHIRVLLVLLRTSSGGGGAVESGEWRRERVKSGEQIPLYGIQ